MEGARRVCDACAHLAFLQNGQFVNENITTPPDAISRSSRASTAAVSKSPATCSAVHCLKPASLVDVSSDSFCGSESGLAHAVGSPVHPSSSSSGMSPSRLPSLTIGPAMGSIVPSGLAALVSSSPSESSALRRSTLSASALSAASTGDAASASGEASNDILRATSQPLSMPASSMTKSISQLRCGHASRG